MLIAKPTRQSDCVSPQGSPHSFQPTQVCRAMALTAIVSSAFGGDGSMSLLRVRSFHSNWSDAEQQQGQEAVIISRADMQTNLDRDDAKLKPVPSSPSGHYKMKIINTLIGDSCLSQR